MLLLGDVSVSEIEERTGITLSDEDREFMKANRQENVSIPLEIGKWHCYDMPFTLVTHDRKTAYMYRDMLMKYNWADCREPIRLSCEN